MEQLEEAARSVPMQVVMQLDRIAAGRGREAAFRDQQPQALDTLLDVARIQSTEASNAIEGIHAPPARIRALMDERTKPRNRSEAEIAGYRSALDMIHASHEHMRVTPSLVLQLHREIFRYPGTPGGEYKSTDNTIEEVRPDGTRAVRFAPPPAWQTASAMQELHERLDRALANPSLHPALAISAYVLDFLCIHPFLDGNGRMSRLLTLLCLYRAGYGAGRYVSLERIIADSRESYYEALGASSAGWHDAANDLWPWTEYLLGTIVAAYDAFEDRVASISSRPGSKRDAIIGFIEARAVDTFTIADIRNAVPTASDSLIRKTLHDLRDTGRIRSTGRGRSAAWTKSS